MVNFPRAVLCRVLTGSYSFQLGKEQGLCVPLRNKTKHLKLKTRHSLCKKHVLSDYLNVSEAMQGWWSLCHHGVDQMLSQRPGFESQHIPNACDLGSSAFSE